MLNQGIAFFAAAIGSFSLLACQAKVLTPSETEAADTAMSAYQAYEMSDCLTVKALTDEVSLDLWEFNEMRHSMLLLRAFCNEIDGEVETARNAYRRLVVEAPSSFAADDAAERIRILKVLESDPNYAGWTQAARDRIDPSRPARTPIDRIPVQFPPLAKATGVQGFAIVEFGVTQRGETENPVVVDSKPPLLFDGASVRAVRRWQYMREPKGDPNDRQLIRLLFRPDGETASTETSAEPMQTEGME